MQHRILFATSLMAILLAGCSTSHKTPTITNTAMSVNAPDFKLKYIASTDTQSLSDPSSSDYTTIPKGTVAYFDRDPSSLVPTPTWMQAKLESGTLAYVRPQDFVKAR